MSRLIHRLVPDLLVMRGFVLRARRGEDGTVEWFAGTMNCRRCPRSQGRHPVHGGTVAKVLRQVTMRNREVAGHVPREM